MQRFRAYALAGSSALAAWGCVESTGPDRLAPARNNEPIQTDSTVYVSRWLRGGPPYEEFGFTLITRYQNTTADTVFLGRCRPDSLQPIYHVSHVNSRGNLVDANNPFQSGYNVVWPCSLTDPHAVAPGAARVDTLDIQGPNAWDGQTKESFGALDGLFQISFIVQYCRRENCVAPRAASVSNIFRVIRR